MKEFTVADDTAGMDLRIDSDILGSGLTKLGAGTMELTGANAYTGTTTVEAGTLLVNGNQTGANGDVTVNGGILGGTGIVGGATTINAGGCLAPGASIGTLTFNADLDISDIDPAIHGGGPLIFEIDAPGDNDMVVLNAGFGLNIGPSLDFSDFSFLDLGGAAPGQYTLFDTGETIMGDLGFRWGNVGSLWAKLWFSDEGGNLLDAPGSNIVLQLQALPFADDPSINFFDFVPEPSRAMLLLFGFCAAFLRRRRS